VHPGVLDGGLSDLEMTWLHYCAGAAVVSQPHNITSTATASCTDHVGEW